MFESVGEGFGVFGDDGAPAYARSVRSFKEVSGAEDVGKIRAGEVARAGIYMCPSKKNAPCQNKFGREAAEIFSRRGISKF